MTIIGECHSLIYILGRDYIGAEGEMLGIE